jgi:hypothetical protein
MRKVAIRVVLLMAALLIVPATASAVTVRLGPPTLQTSNTAVFCPTDDCSYAFGSVTAPGGVLASPADGTVTAWRLEGDIPSSSSLIVVHPDGTQWT